MREPSENKTQRKQRKKTHTAKTKYQYLPHTFFDINLS